jgi:hypothetical protein
VLTEKVYSFEECLKNSGSAQKLLLVGNGFSISLFPNIFSYSSLLDKANFSDSEPVQRLFNDLGTSDFEEVLRNLAAGLQIAKAYQLDQKIIDAISADISLVRDRLVQAIAGSHPASPNEITDQQYKSCRQFLKRFSRIYSLNYDLLLYWALMRKEVDQLGIEADDGFRSSPADPNADFVTWESHNSATVHYLHGALHLFDAGAELRKYTWVRTGTPLMEQIRAALDAALYPLFVAEGSSTSKADRILHHGYLHKVFRSFESISGHLFVYGHSLSDNDDHFFNLLRRCDNRITGLYVGLHGDGNSDSNKKIIAKARSIEADREKCRRKLSVDFFDSSTANVWTA